MSPVGSTTLDPVASRQRRRAAADGFGSTCRAVAVGLALCLTLFAGGTLVSLAGWYARWLQWVVSAALLGVVGVVLLRMMSRRR